MKNTYQYLVALSLAATSLSSCSRANYASNSQTLPALHAEHTVATPSSTVAPSAEAPAMTATALVVAPASVPVPPVEAVRVPAPPVEVAVAATTPPAVAATPAKVTQPTLVQRLAVKKILKQVAKAEARKQNTAGVAHTAAKGGALTVAIVGLAALVVGLIVSSGFLITVGAIVLVVGIVLLILSIL